MICYICHTNITHWKALVTHFKIFHLLKSDSTYKCCENNCTQSFQCLGSFKRHMIGKHTSRLVAAVASNSSDNFKCTSLSQNNGNIENTVQSNDDTILTSEIQFDIDFAVETIYKSAVTFIVSLHDNNNFTLKDVSNIQAGVMQNLLTPIISTLKNVIKTEIKEPSSLLKFNQVITAITNPFQHCNSEYRLFNWLKTNNILSEIQQFTINNEICPVQHMGESVFDEKHTKGALLPMKLQFKNYFEHADNFKNQLNKLQKLHLSNDNNISNFVQGNLWQQKISNHSKDKILIPYFLYIDDAEINNPLGSHAMAQQISAIYYNFPLAENSSKLKNIFLAALIKSFDLKKYGNDSCIQSLVTEINFLENDGIDIITLYGNFHVHFVLGLILGDNLGLNSILEFSKSFSANFYCRFCKASKTRTRVMCEEDQSLMRNISNYCLDVSSQNFSETGIYKDSILNQITSFHVIQNFCLDTMHDLYEGICHYDMCHIINYYINTAKLFTLDTLNSRKVNFNYGPIESGNLSTEISVNHLNNMRLKMSAREMMTFIHFFPLMIGDLVPENDEVWCLFLILLQIVDVLLSYTFNSNLISHLKQLISKHNYQYQMLFNDTLKPKHHFLTHYPTIIENSGPPRHYWSFRFEAKHKEMKMYARSITSRKNITLTLAKKFQLKFAHFLLQPNELKIILKEKHKIQSKYIETINKTLQLSPHTFSCYSELKFNGIFYKEGFYLTKFSEEMNLFKIVEIIVIDQNDEVVFILGKPILLENFDTHYESYVVINDEEVCINCVIYRANDFSGPPLNVTNISTGKRMLRLKQFY